MMNQNNFVLVFELTKELDNEWKLKGFVKKAESEYQIVKENFIKEKSHETTRSNNS